MSHLGFSNASVLQAHLLASVRRLLSLSAFGSMFAAKPAVPASIPDANRARKLPTYRNLDQIDLSSLPLSLLHIAVDPACLVLAGKLAVKALGLELRKQSNLSTYQVGPGAQWRFIHSGYTRDELYAGLGLDALQAVCGVTSAEFVANVDIRAIRELRQYLPLDPELWTPEFLSARLSANVAEPVDSPSVHRP
ncbi:hypothetical protein [Xanthomonas citri]|uniref:hypothetical protein n=1 Tax=Xanthomonas citri TaxID=346 RepID=UPI000CCFBFE9|nr:hypothetical protein [Xanthomonas citri]PNV26655.1 hypothetical protein xavtCFBP7764_22415 [Xanthomonas citri]